LPHAPNSTNNNNTNAKNANANVPNTALKATSLPIHYLSLDPAGRPYQSNGTTSFLFAQGGSNRRLPMQAQGLGVMGGGSVRPLRRAG